MYSSYSKYNYINFRCSGSETMLDYIYTNGVGKLGTSIEIPSFLLPVFLYDFHEEFVDDFMA